METMGYSLIRFGNVCDVDAAKGYVRVDLDEDGITTHWLPIVVPGAKSNKYFAMPVVNEHVVCMLDENCEEGVVIGSLYSDVDTPVTFGENLSGVVFEDGSKVVFDSTTKTVMISTTGKVVIEAAEKVSIKNETETLKAILTDLIDAILAETHTTATGPSGTPINFAQYESIKNRVNSFLE